MRISVVVCGFSDARFGQLVSAVESLRAQTLAPAEIIVVIDGNSACSTGRARRSRMRS